MAESQEQFAQDMTALSETVDKIGDETSGLKQKIADLEGALQSAGNITPEVEAAFAALKAQVKTVDDLVEDKVPDAEPVAEATDTETEPVSEETSEA